MPRDALGPSKEPTPRAWTDVPHYLWNRFFADRLTTNASSVAFYLVLASIPGIAAVVSVYGVLANPNDVTRLTQTLAELLPNDIVQLIDRQIRRFVGGDGQRGASTLGSVVWFAIVLWSANRGTRGMVDALNVIHDRADERPFFHKLAVTLALTLGAVVFLAVAVFGVLLLPALFRLVGLGAELAGLFTLLRWPVLFLVVATALAALYRFGPSRRASPWRPILLGSAAGAVLWIAFALLFSWYVQTFGSFVALYGSLGAAVGFMVWLWLSALAVLFGAEIDAAAMGIGRRA